MMKEANDIELLEALVVNNPDLVRLEYLLSQFNIFEALGAVKVELRHTDFLAFLLAPNQSHGLGDTFAKRFLQAAVKLVPGLSIRPIDLDLWDLNELIVLREWQNIDILLMDEHNRFYTVIENKIGSAEHSNQLTRYRQIVEQQYRNWRGLYLFLTPEGEEPTDPSYIPIDYGLIAALVEQYVESQASTINSDVRILMTHYCQMLRRHIVSGSEIEELCQKIYRKHQQALDLIYEYRPDLQAALYEVLVKIVSEHEEFVLDHSSKVTIRFAPKIWDVPMLRGQGWTGSGRMLLFEFWNHADRLNLNLVLGPAPDETRQKIFEIAHANRPPFKPAYRALGKVTNTIYQKSMLTSKAYEDASLEDLESEIRKKWKHFLEHDLPEIQEVLNRLEWIWQVK